MRRFVRSVLAVSTVVALSSLGSNTLQAQGQSLELRADFVAIENDDGDTSVNLLFPGAFAMAFYMNEYVGVEPRLIISHVSQDDDDSGTFFVLGAFLPIHLAPTMGRSGVFLSPGIEFAKATGDFESDAVFNYGLDVGIKSQLRERIATRFAVTLRDGDSYDDPAIGATFGIGFFWR